MEEGMKSLKKNVVPENSSMASDMKQVKELGKEMERMDTGQELQEEKHLYTDPIQELNGQEK
ncbi:hypothetical protein [Bacillus testis]|uniref:hypothetical protein n=1 Tax=Bacillus testis TaxID=1622072 RepID=UPI00067ED769|nr:hypothetical protein [Bacillus testis]